jgi:hypothetical protein
MMQSASTLRKQLEGELADMERQYQELPPKIRSTRKLIVALEAFESTNGNGSKVKSRNKPDLDLRVKRNIECPECGKMFANLPGLGSHRRTHGIKGTSR